jgi:hypothetical protein
MPSSLGFTRILLSDIVSPSAALAGVVFALALLAKGRQPAVIDGNVCFADVRPRDALLA